MGETARLLEETADRIFAEEAGPARETLAGGVWPARLWQAFERAGLARALLPEEKGGAGFEAGLAILRAAGRHGAPIPVAETQIAHLVCESAGVPAPEGPLAMAAVPTGGGRLDDALRRVPWARHAAAVAVTVPDRGVALGAPTGIGEGANLAGEPRDRIAFDGGEAAFRRLPPGIDGFGLMALARAALLRGAMERTLAMSLDYAGARTQFGRPIGAFQAIQHHLVRIAGETASSGAAVDAAARTRTPFAFAAAKAQTSQAAGEVARLAHQIHGAIGFTWEHALHHWTKRLWAWRDEYGNEAYWWGMIGHRIARGGPGALWRSVVSAGEPVQQGTDHER